MKPLLVLCSIFISSVSLFAQNKFLKAKIYKTDNSVIDVYIKKNFSKKTPQFFDYAINPAGPFQTINSDTINRLEFEEGRIFEKNPISVPVMVKSYMERTLPDYDRKENQLSRSVLIEKVMSGRISFYIFIDKYDFEHFFYKHESDTGVTYIPYKSYVNDRKIWNEDLSFRRMVKELSGAYQCAESLDSLIEKLTYERRPMLAMFQKLNDCAGTPVDINPYLARTKSRFQYGILGGATATNIKQEHFQAWSVRPTLGAFFQIVPGRGYPKCFFNTEVSFRSYTATEPYESYNISGKAVVKSATINFDPSVRFFFKNEPGKFFLKGGINFRWVVSGSQIVYSQSGAQSVNHHVKGLQYGVLAGGGYDFRTFDLEVQYGRTINKLVDYFEFFGLTSRIKLK